MRVIQVGLGTWGRSWAQLARDAEGVELAAVADPAPEARQWARTELGVGCYGSLCEALEGTASEAVLVVTPPRSHPAPILEALAAGKHVLVEKPLATTLPDARSLVDAAARAGRVLMVDQNYRFTRPARAAQRAVAEGAIGDLVGVRIACRRDTRALFPPDDFRYAMRHPYVMDMAIHHFDLLRAITGRDVRRIYGRSWRAPDSPFAHDPTVVAVMELEGGATVAYEGDWATTGPETSWSGEWELVGEDGRLLWTTDREDRNTGEVTLHRWGSPPRGIEQPPLASVEREGALRSLLTAVEDGEQPETSAADNISSLAVVLGCVRSIEGGEVVDVAELLDGGAGR